MTTRKTTKIIVLIITVLLTQRIVPYKTSLKLENNTMNKTIEIAIMEEKFNEFKEEEKERVLNTYSGDLTGYGANCALCGGHLGCNGMDVRDGTTTYDDKEYGEVRIVASSKKLKCGSIVKFEAKSISGNPIYAIVLDRGVSGNDLDLLVESEQYASKHIGRKKITYDLLRNGWNK